MIFMNRAREIRAAALSLRDGQALYGELECRFGVRRLVNAQTFPVPSDCMSGGRVLDGARLGAMLRKNFRRRLQKIPLLLGIPTAECICRFVTIPAADCAEAREALRWKFAGTFPFACADALYDVSEAIAPTPAENGISVLAAAAQKKELMPLFAALDGSSFCLCAAEPLAVACARALCPPDFAELAFLTVAAGDSAQFILVNRGTVVMFRSSPLPREARPPASLSALREEFVKTLEYVRGRFLCEPALFAAGSAEEAAALADAAGSAVAPLAPIHPGHRMELCSPLCSGWSDVAGLLLRCGYED